MQIDIVTISNIARILMSGWCNYIIFSDPQRFPKCFTPKIETQTVTEDDVTLYPAEER